MKSFRVKLFSACSKLPDHTRYYVSEYSDATAAILLLVWLFNTMSKRAID